MKARLIIVVVLLLASFISACGGDTAAQQSPNEVPITTTSTVQTETDIMPPKSVSEQSPEPALANPSLQFAQCPASPKQEGPATRPELGPPYNTKTVGEGWIIDHLAMVHVMSYMVKIAGDDSQAERAGRAKLIEEYNIEAGKIYGVQSIRLTFYYFPVKMDAEGKPIEPSVLPPGRGRGEFISDKAWWKQELAKIATANTELDAARASLDPCAMLAAQIKADSLKREYTIEAGKNPARVDGWGYPIAYPLED